MTEDKIIIQTDSALYELEYIADHYIKLYKPTVKERIRNVLFKLADMLINLGARIDK